VVPGVPTHSAQDITAEVRVKIGDETASIRSRKDMARGRMKTAAISATKATKMGSSLGELLAGIPFILSLLFLTIV
jgi:hypothetical protein